MTKSKTHIIPYSTFLYELTILENANQYVKFVHLHYLGWPDFGAPKETEPIINLVKDVRQIIATNPNLKTRRDKFTVLVHCSAGVGRTGTFIALYQMMEKLDILVPQFEKGGIYRDLTIDIFNTAFNLRHKRVFMVCTQT